MILLRRCQHLRLRPLIRLCSAELIHKDGFIEKLRHSFEEDVRSNLVVPTFKRAMLYPDEIAVKDINGEYTYFQLYLVAKRLAIQISNICGSASLSNVAYLCSSNALWIAIQWSCWISGQVAVPLECGQPIEHLRSQATGCKAKLLIATPEFEEMAQEISLGLQSATIVLNHSFVPPAESVSSTSMYVKQLVSTQGDLLTEGTLPSDFYAGAPAMLVHTPNSVNKPKAVLLSHRNIDAHIRCLIDSWHLSSSDCLLPILSLNRMNAAVGGILSVGGTVILQQKFDCHNAWSALLGINSPTKQRVTIFLAMPIVYKRLIAEYDKMFAKDSRMVEYILNHCRQRIRLMATGYALLPDSVFQRWREITGQNIYEYYGMVETGLVLGHPLEDPIGASNGNTSSTTATTTSPTPNPNVTSEKVDYRPGTLGAPLKGVTARLISSKGTELITCKNELGGNVDHGLIQSDMDLGSDLPISQTVIGELQIAKSDMVSQSLGGGINGRQIDPEAIGCKVEETPDGFVKTGDICAYQNGNFYFLSKISDVFTVGGYKVYGSEIKKVLISHPSINDVAVLGIPNKVWGHRLGVICIVSPDADIDLDAIKTYCYRHLPAHKCPTVFKTLISK
ncbi:acyl-CoA synthetase family member 3, mitochondrial [Drosophila serrata]|uniref:acyl-CoA synthetase family member 3, mitochondrial n=1 Tax=Drosophila serrata TaxID=7274 RepID=UPI000A1D06C9|nr:acyl-CoA synthetase family member 3, mitochondrial [Drosophila serrata]